jgi:hypothetical protein
MEISLDCTDALEQRKPRDRLPSAVILAGPPGMERLEREREDTAITHDRAVSHGAGCQR